MSEIIFLGHCKFTGSIFSGGVYFNGSQFSQEVYFDGASFNGWTEFKKVTFNNNAEFRGNDEGSSFEVIDFSGSQFMGWADFSGRIFKRPSYFLGCQFNFAPLFYGSDLHEGTTIAEAIFHGCNDYFAPRAFRSLKLSEEKLRDWNAMAKFYALEQKSQRHQPNTPWTIKLTSWLYEVTSDYGQSFGRPLAWLGGVAYAWFFLYCLTLVGAEYDDGMLADVLKFDLMQMVRPFHALVFADMGTGPFKGLGTFGRGVVMGLAAVQTLATAGFVTLFILAVRRRFRMA